MLKMPNESKQEARNVVSIAHRRKKRRRKKRQTAIVYVSGLSSSLE
jgi:ACT domain-containing protein